VTRSRLRASRPGLRLAQPPAPVQVTRPANPVLWRAAVRRAGGDPLRVVVVAPGQVDVYPDRELARRARARLT
jgi:hypothetical protein